MPAGSPHRVFRCRCVLLYWTGDYPAQAAVSGTHSKLCHWCRCKSTYSPETNRRCWDGYRRYTGAYAARNHTRFFFIILSQTGHDLSLADDNHPFRRDAAHFGTIEEGPAPSNRTHREYMDDARRQMLHRGLKKDQPYKTTGVKEQSPLHVLPMFDVVWDVTMCLMHAVPRIWKGHIFPMMRGKRYPAQPKPRKKFTALENAALMGQHAAAKAALKTWKLDKVFKCRNFYVSIESFVNNFDCCLFCVDAFVVLSTRVDVYVFYVDIVLRRRASSSTIAQCS